MATYLLAIAIALFAAWYVLLHAFRSAVAPAPLWLFAWAILYLCAVIFGADYNYTIEGVTILGLIAFAFPFGCLLATSVSLPSAKYALDTSGLNKVSPFIQLFCGAAGLVGAHSLSANFGGSLFHFESIVALTVAAKRASVLLESGQETLPVSASIAFAFLQMAFLLNGVRMASRNTSLVLNVGLLGLLFAITTLWTVATTSRGYFLVGILWFLGSYIATKILIGEESNFIRPKVVLLTAGTAIALILVIVVFQSFRMGDYRLELFQRALAHMRPWIAGYITGFSVWYRDVWSSGADQGGSIFEGLFKAVGIVQQQSFNRMATQLDIGDGDSTNALTVAKMFIADFGLIGGILFAGIVGYASQLVYQACRQGWAIGWLLQPGVVVTILWSPNFWFMGYGSRVLALILFVGLGALIVSRPVLGGSSGISPQPLQTKQS